MVALFEVSLLTLFFERRARGKKVRLNGLPREGWRTCPQLIRYVSHESAGLLKDVCSRLHQSAINHSRHRSTRGNFKP